MSALLGMRGGGTKPCPACRSPPGTPGGHTVAVPEAGARMSMPGAASLCLESKRQRSSGFKRVSGERRRLHSAGLAAGRRSRPARGQHRSQPRAPSNPAGPRHFQLALKPSRAPLAVSSVRARIILSVVINNSARDAPLPI